MADKKTVEGSQTKKTTLRSYASRVFKESSVGMVSSLAETSSTRRRIFKVLALIFCLTGFLYQSGKFLAVVFQYPTIVDIDILRPNLLNVPGYTFCDNNGINRRVFCEKFPDHCEEPTEAFCNKYEYYCGENKTLVPKKEYYTMNTNVTLDEMIELNVEMHDFVSYYRNEEKVTGPYLRVRDFSEPTFMCYSLNDRVNNSLPPLQKNTSTIFRQAANKFKFTVRDDEMFLPGNRAGILFSIHSPFEAVNPFETGIFMKPGRTYMVFVSMEEEILLKEPYETNCVNYTERWDKNGRTGPRMQNMCRQDCLAKISMKCYNCVFPLFLFPTHERYCTAEDTESHDNCPDQNYVERLIKKCEMNCRDDCRQTKYRYTVQERFKPSFDEDGHTTESLDSTIEVEIFLEGDEIIVLKHSPKYMIVEVFSSIGGFIGCWLGINLLDITDIFEGFFRIFRYSFKRR